MKYIFSSILVVILLVVGVMIFSSPGKSADKSDNNAQNQNNVITEGDKQVIEITAKGGFTPRKSSAKSGIPTTLRVDTNGTFDCSSIIRIPSMNITKNLPPSGVTDIDLGSRPVGTLYGTCGMGMYPFEISFN